LVKNKALRYATDYMGSQTDPLKKMASGNPERPINISIITDS
tara:strand:+ start:362 stop:487 length:126 start_codon:yes stop_codon:yes gene_type:complete